MNVFVGNAEGPLDGAREGLKDGLVVGDAEVDGTMDGCRVGPFEGATTNAVGSTVGSANCKVLGALVGVKVNMDKVATVGMRLVGVGAVVGAGLAVSTKMFPCKFRLRRSSATCSPATKAGATSEQKSKSAAEASLKETFMVATQQ